MPGFRPRVLCSLALLASCMHTQTTPPCPPSRLPATSLIDLPPMCRQGALWLQALFQKPYLHQVALCPHVSLA